jgi:hypothetical protein
LKRDVHCGMHRTSLLEMSACAPCCIRLRTALEIGTEFLKGCALPDGGPPPLRLELDGRKEQELLALHGLPWNYQLPKSLYALALASQRLTAKEIYERWLGNGGAVQRLLCPSCEEKRHQGCTAPQMGTASKRDKVCACFCKYLCPPCCHGASIEGDDADHRACSGGDCACARCVPSREDRDALRNARKRRWSVEEFQAGSLAARKQRDAEAAGASMPSPLAPEPPRPGPPPSPPKAATRPAAPTRAKVAPPPVVEQPVTPSHAEQLQKVRELMASLPGARRPPAR